ncbi:MAG TPA: acetolactate synthase large subunit [Gammaproteobacteria bacterium]|nr:acetolactate synthase large subunit [Gammaproteobacteria bacterium]
MLAQPTLSDRLIAYLNQLGVEYVFGIPGGHNAPLYAALLRSATRGGCAAVMTRHESGAVYMADGYARETGKLGVCCATTGPGATNLITGVASAYAEHTPLLVITAQTMLSHFGWGAFQECSPDTVDTLGMFAHCTRYNTLISHPGQLDKKIYAALAAALNAPQGPAHISIPVDLLRAPVAEGASELPDLRGLLHREMLDDAALEQAWQRLQACARERRKAVLLVGQDCPGATAEIHALAEYLDAAIVTTQGGKTWVAAHHPRVRGVFGFAGHASARQAVVEADLILALGTTLGQWATSNWDAVLLNEKLIHVHPIGEYFARSAMAQLHVQGHVRSVLQWCLERAAAPALPSWEEKPVEDAAALPPHIEVRDAANYHSPSPDERILPPRVIALLQRHAPAATRYLVDIGNWLAWTIHYSFPPQAECIRLSVGTAAMGWGIGAAVGTAFGNPSTGSGHRRATPVVCFTGDGCFLMHGNELSVAVEHRLRVIFVIINDQSYGMVRHRYQQVGSAPLTFDLPPTDFSLLAQALGATGYTLRNAEELEQFDFAALFQHDGPVVLDLRVDAGIVPPLGMF